MDFDFLIGSMGLLIGFLVGLTGVGGAALLTPILIIIGINPTIAVGTDLAYNSVTKLVGTIQHWRQKTVNWQIVKYLAVGSVPGAIVSIGLLRIFQLELQDDIIKHALGVILIAVAILTIYQQFFRNKNKPSKVEKIPPKKKMFITVLAGFVLGFIVGLTSVGSGSLFALIIIYLYRIKASEVVGTDIAHAFLLVSVAGLLHAGIGNVDIGLTLNLLAGSIPGVLVGSSLSAKVPGRPLRAIVAAIILIGGIKLI